MLILQGMRRSGTTITYDALTQDPQLTCWYEPLAAAKQAAVGGGSGARDVDAFAEVRKAREAFFAERDMEPTDVLNDGAPKDATLEFTGGFPEIVEDYLKYILLRPEPVAAKFTRLYGKVRRVHELFPDAGFVHLVRDPRSVAVSYLFGKGRRYEKKMGPKRVFFGKCSDRSAWSSYPISELILKEYEAENLPAPTDLERVLLVWRYTFEKVHQDAAATYGERSICVKHEAYCKAPQQELDRIYALENRNAPPEAVQWAKQNLRPPSPIHAEGDKRWRRAFDRMGMSELVESVGYSV